MEKIKYIKMLLSTIILTLIIISMFKSCTYAYTFEELEEYINYYEFQTQIGNTEWQNNRAVERLAFLYNNYYSWFEELCKNASSTIDVIACYERKLGQKLRNRKYNKYKHNEQHN